LTHRSLFLLPFCIFLLKAQHIEKACLPGYESIKEAELKKNLAVLTSDSLEGRETGFPGQRKAANFIAGIFKGLKLEPIGDNSTYFQHFDVELTHVDPETKIITDVGGVKKIFRWGIDFISESTKDTIVNGQPVFVGFTDTEIDSASKERLAGKIVFIFIGKRNYADDSSKAATLRRLYAIRRDAGALAALMIPDFEGPATFQQAKQIMISNGWDKGSMKLKSNKQTARLQSLRFLISPAIADEILALSGRTLKQVREEALNGRQFTPVFINNAELTIDARVVREIRQTENVLGLLAGSDPKLKKQVVAITAHYDHLGKSSDGTLYPGADDDGSGTVSVLELASAFAKNPIRPKRSLLFMTFVGEEKGLFGSQYYTGNPIVPLNQTMADINIDMVGRIDTIHEFIKDTNYIYIIGSDKISLELDSILKIANNETSHLTLDYSYNDDEDPEQFYRRSDHFNFAKNGIPIVFFFDGIHRDYHRSTDSAEKILFRKIAGIDRLIYDLGWRLANFDRPLKIIPAHQ
jgi:hypothetical protein